MSHSSRSHSHSVDRRCRGEPNGEIDPTYHRQLKMVETRNAKAVSELTRLLNYVTAERLHNESIQSDLRYHTVSSPFLSTPRSTAISSGGLFQSPSPKKADSLQSSLSSVTLTADSPSAQTSLANTRHMLSTVTSSTFPVPHFPHAPSVSSISAGSDILSGSDGGVASLPDTIPYRYSSVPSLKTTSIFQPDFSGNRIHVSSETQPYSLKQNFPPDKSLNSSFSATSIPSHPTSPVSVPPEVGQMYHWEDLPEVNSGSSTSIE